jgi:hypothetical protein
MIHRPSTLERAYELARSGTVANVDGIRAQLKREGHEAVDAHLLGPAIRRHLRDLCLAANKPAETSIPIEAATPHSSQI